ncbi:hypothetical protein [Streptosporangium sp. NPDC051022]|uniref:hypothetical protein n=1 Tax=Streptosporangium sp. NPDC051022 TaxID=3155752 RepID=UPI00343A0FDF
MPTAKLSMIAIIVVVCLGIGVAWAAPVAYWVLTYGCRADEDRLAAALATLGVLDAHPANATPQEERNSSCDSDDRITSVWQNYRFSGPRADVLSFYRDIAIMDGWVLSPDDDGEGGICFTKSFGETEADLSVDFSKAGGEYGVHVTSSVNGGGWGC